MPCQKTVTLGSNLTFTITTHDPDTGELTDTDVPPIYRVYRAEAAAPVLTGAMAKLDDANTLGFYSGQLICVTANGFADEQSYNIYIEATVDGDTGGISYGFVVRLALVICFVAVVGDAMGGYGIVLADAFGGYAVAVSDARFCP